MTGNLGTYIVFVLGILVGGILFNKEFRVKFFKGLRGFIGQLGRGAREYNRKYEEQPRDYRRETDNIRREVSSQPEVQHVYKRVHNSTVCSVCQGSGKVYEKASPLQKGAPGFEPKAIDCPECKGEGRVWD